MKLTLNVLANCICNLFLSNYGRKRAVEIDSTYHFAMWDFRVFGNAVDASFLVAVCSKTVDEIDSKCFGKLPLLFLFELNRRKLVNEVDSTCNCSDIFWRYSCCFFSCSYGRKTFEEIDSTYCNYVKLEIFYWLFFQVIKAEKTWNWLYTLLLREV